MEFNICFVMLLFGFGASGRGKLKMKWLIDCALVGRGFEKRAVMCNIALYPFKCWSYCGLFTSEVTSDECGIPINNIEGDWNEKDELFFAGVHVQAC